MRSFNEGDAAGLYAVSDNEFRRTCALKELEATFALLKSVGTSIKIEDFKISDVKVDGSRATAQITARFPGESTETSTQEFVKEDGAWRFVSEDSGCPGASVEEPASLVIRRT